MKRSTGRLHKNSEKKPLIFSPFLFPIRETFLSFFHHFSTNMHSPISVNNYYYCPPSVQHLEDEEEEYDDFDFSSPSSSAFESCSSVLTDDSTVVSCTESTKEEDPLDAEEEEEEQEQEELDFSLYPPITLPFHESLSFNMLKLYQVILPKQNAICHID